MAMGSKSAFVALAVTFAAVAHVGAVTSICKPNQNIDPVLIPFIRSDIDPFCMNSGTCKSNYVEQPEFPCDCPKGFAGPHCEFRKKDVPDCNLQCFNQGVCQVGIRSYMDLSNLPALEDYNYCRCPEGFYGDQCEIRGKVCGTTHCLNGGECIQIEHTDGRVTDHCDCTKATKDGQRVAGRFCQSAATSSCSNHDPVNPSNICVNGGTCHIDPLIGCECPKGYYGSLCEFSEQEQGAWECNMDCGEHGFCRKGVKDNSFIDNFNFNDRRLTQRFTQDFEHCVCEPGWSGLECNIRMDVCPGEKMICLHGADCMLSDKLAEFACECDSADEQGLKYSGKYCQYHATAFCTIDGLLPNNKGEAYCTNNGLCKDFVMHDEPHPGCVCDDAFAGDHCEILLDDRMRTSGHSSGGGGNGTSDLALFAIIMCTFLAILLIILLLIWHRRRRMQRLFKSNAAEQHLNSIEPYLDSTKKRSSKLRNTPYNPDLESIYEEAYFGEPFKDETEIGGDSDSESGSDITGSDTSSSNFTSSSNEVVAYTTEEEHSSFPPTMQELHTFNSSDLKDDLRYAYSSDQAYNSNGYSNDSSADVYVNDQSTTKKSNLQRQGLLALPSSSASFEEANRAQLDSMNAYDPQELEDMVQKRRRTHEERHLRQVFSSPDSSEVASMSSVGSSTHPLQKTIPGADSFGSYARAYSLGMEHEYKSGTESDAADVPTDYDFSNCARFDREAQETRTAARSEHYKSMGSGLEKTSIKYPWRDENEKSTLTTSSRSPSDPSGDKICDASKGADTSFPLSTASSIASKDVLLTSSSDDSSSSSSSSDSCTEDDMNDTSTISSRPSSAEWESSVHKLGEGEQSI